MLPYATFMNYLVVLHRLLSVIRTADKSFMPVVIADKEGSIINVAATHNSMGVVQTGLFEGLKSRLTIYASPGPYAC